MEVDASGSYGAKGYQEFQGLGVVGGGAAGGGGAGLITEDLRSYGQHGQFLMTQEELIDSGMAGGQHVFSQYRGGAFDGMALSEQFLDEYYSSVSIFKPKFVVILKDEDKANSLIWKPTTHAAFFLLCE